MLENAYIKASNLNTNVLVQSAFSPQQNRRQFPVNTSAQNSTKSLLNDEAGISQDYKSSRQAAYANNLYYGSYDQVLANRALPPNPLSNSSNVPAPAPERSANQFSSHNNPQPETANYQLQAPLNQTNKPQPSKDYEMLKMKK